MKPAWVRLGAPLILCSVLHGAPARATTLLKTDLKELTRSSAAVVRGTVQRVQSHWAGDHMHIVTEVDISVAETLKGQPGKTVHVVQPGGQVGDIAQMVSGLASFTPGEDVVVFLQARGTSSTYLVSGMAQGKYKVQRSAVDGSLMAVPESTGEALLIDPLTRTPTTATAQTLRLEALRAQVRTNPAAKGTGQAQ